MHIYCKRRALFHSPTESLLFTPIMLLAPSKPSLTIFSSSNCSLLMPSLLVCKEFHQLLLSSHEIQLINLSYCHSLYSLDKMTIARLGLYRTFHQLQSRTGNSLLYIITNKSAKTSSGSFWMIYGEVYWGCFRNRVFNISSSQGTSLHRRCKNFQKMTPVEYLIFVRGSINPPHDLSERCFAGQCKEDIRRFHVKTRDHIGRSSDVHHPWR